VQVNEITPELFRAAPDAHAMSQLPVHQIERLIKAIGLAPTKARNISAMSAMLLERHQGQVGCWCRGGGLPPSAGLGPGSLRGGGGAAAHLLQGA
jgi:hypothetical protein